MKVVIFILLTVFILFRASENHGLQAVGSLFLKSTSPLPECTYKTASQAIAPRIFAEQTIDGPNQPIILTRFLHNKLGIYTSELVRCYFNVFDLNFIAGSTGLIGFIFWLYFIYATVNKKHWRWLALLLILPIGPFFLLPQTIIVSFHKIFAIIGLILFLKLSLPRKENLKLR